MSIVYYRKVVNGRVFPVKAREGGRFAFAHEVKREGLNVKTKYLGILRVPDGAVVDVQQNVVEIPNVVEITEGGMQANG